MGSVFGFGVLLAARRSPRDRQGLGFLGALSTCSWMSRRSEFLIADDKKDNRTLLIATAGADRFRIA